jgi:hypothetical protein
MITVLARAEQITFSQTKGLDVVSTDYQWRDHEQQTQALTFSLNKQAVYSQYGNQTKYKPQIAQRYVYVELMHQARLIDPKEARVNILQRGENIEVQVTSHSAQTRQKWIANMTEKRESAFAQYLTDNHFTQFTDHLGSTGIIPDHIRYIQESTAILRPVAQALYDQIKPNSDSRDYVYRLLSWVQSIPYDSLQSRIDGSGAGFYTPVEVLMNNKGDCDSKAVLTASLLRALLPNLSISIVYLPNHALLAVNLGQRLDEQHIDVAGTPHVLIEPTGPAVMPIGNIAEDTAIHIANGNYQTIPVP